MPQEARPLLDASQQKCHGVSDITGDRDLDHSVTVVSAGLPTVKLPLLLAKNKFLCTHFLPRLRHTMGQR